MPAPIPQDARSLVRLLDAGDGSGDLILPIPAALWDRLSALGWREGMPLEIEPDPSGRIALRPAGSSQAPR